MVRHIYLCENSAEGIFSAIYRAYEEGYPHEHNEVVIDTEGRNMELFCEYHTVVTNFEHAVKVARTIRRKISEEAYDFIHRCCGSYEAQKADAIYRFVQEGLRMGRAVMSHLTAPYMQTLFAIERNFTNESHFFIEILRFTVHRTVLLHKANYKTVYLSMDEVDMDELTLTYSEDEKQLQKLWKLFVDTIAIKERVNPKLQRQMLPLRFRKYMKEFSESE